MQVDCARRAAPGRAARRRAPAVVVAEAGEALHLLAVAMRSLARAHAARAGASVHPSIAGVESLASVGTSVAHDDALGAAGRERHALRAGVDLLAGGQGEDDGEENKGSTHASQLVFEEDAAPTG